MASTEKDRQFSSLLLQQNFDIIDSKEESLYYIGRLEYCDLQDNCYYFMRCAELGNTEFIGMLPYCGTREDP